MKHIILNTTNVYTCLKKREESPEAEKENSSPCMCICDESVMKRGIRKNPGGTAWNSWWGCAARLSKSSERHSLLS